MDRPIYEITVQEVSQRNDVNFVGDRTLGYYQQNMKNFQPPSEICGQFAILRSLDHEANYHLVRVIYRYADPKTKYGTEQLYERFIKIDKPTLETWEYYEPRTGIQEVFESTFFSKFSIKLPMYRGLIAAAKYASIITKARLSAGTLQIGDKFYCRVIQDNNGNYRAIPPHNYT